MARLETDAKAVLRRLAAEGWLHQGGSKHDKYPHPDHPGIRIMVPRHKVLTEGVPLDRERCGMGLRRTEMTQYLALIDGEAGAYGVAFPDAPGCVAMGATLDEVYANAVEALREWMADRLADGQPVPDARPFDAIATDPQTRLTPSIVTALVPLLLDTGRSVRANISIDANLLHTIDEAARERGLTRSAFLASPARDKIAARRLQFGPRCDIA